MTHITLDTHPSQQHHGAHTRAAVAHGVECILPKILQMHAFELGVQPDSATGEDVPRPAPFILLDGQVGVPGVEAHHPECYLRVQGNWFVTKCLRVGVHPMRLKLSGCGLDDFEPTLAPEYHVYVTQGDTAIPPLL